MDFRWKMNFLSGESQEVKEEMSLAVVKFVHLLTAVMFEEHFHPIRVDCD